MKGILVIVLLFVIVSVQALAGNHHRGQLIWADEFNRRGLPDSTHWVYEEGFVRNQEKQYYTVNRPENIFQRRGKLEIRSLKEEYKGAHYTSASINTFDKVSFDGDIRVEVRAKLPEGKGIWPAIWMMGTSRKVVGWPQCSELDIMEYVGHTPHTIFATLHWTDSTSVKPNHHKMKGNHVVISDIHKKFHVYALERRGLTVSVYLDKQELLKVTPPATAYPWTFKGPLFLLLNTAIGGSWGGEIDDSIFPQKYYIDYVRVYRL